MPNLIADDEALTPEERWWQDQADEWHRTALPRTREAADTWLKGLASITGLLALVTLFKGPETLLGLPAWARIAIGAGTLAAFILVVVATGAAAHAASGSPRKTRSTYADLQLRADEELKSAAGMLRLSRVCAVVSLVPLLAAVGLAWYVPRQPKRMVVTRTDGSVLCLPAAAQVIVTTSEVRTVRLADVCP